MSSIFEQVLMFRPAVEEIVCAADIYTRRLVFGIPNCVDAADNVDVVQQKLRLPGSNLRLESPPITGVIVQVG